LLKHYHQHIGKKEEENKGLSTTYKKSIDISSKQSRRHDGLKHFPFVDEFGSVMDVLQEVGETSKQPTRPEAMMDPILKHTIKKVYDEFKIGSNGLKASAIPEALKVDLSPFVLFIKNIRH
jgi:hypothetical protein